MTTPSQQAAAAFFRARLTFQTDVSDVHAALTAAPGSALNAGVGSGPFTGPGSTFTVGPGSGLSADLGSGLSSDRGADLGSDRRADQGAKSSAGLVVIDSRSRAAWDQAHILGAIHLPTADIPARAAALLDPGVPVVAYCWGPGCNGATRAALALSEAGFDAKEMLGGIEYWIREGFPVRTEKGEEIAEPDPLTAPRPANAACGC
jgi:rhodanese-related sulfurtransferase